MRLWKRFCKVVVSMSNTWNRSQETWYLILNKISSVNLKCLQWSISISYYWKRNTSMLHLSDLSINIRRLSLNWAYKFYLNPDYSFLLPQSLLIKPSLTRQRSSIDHRFIPDLWLKTHWYDSNEFILVYIGLIIKGECLRNVINTGGMFCDYQYRH